MRLIGRLASDKITKLGRQLDLTRITQLVENAPSAVMYTDLDLKIRYMNPASVKLLRRIEPYLPVKVDDMIGQTIDIFQDAPGHQRRPPADPRKACPTRPRFRVGPEHMEASGQPRSRMESGNYLGPMLTWDLVTERLEATAREAELAADTRAINQLLLAVGRAETISGGN